MTKPIFNFHRITTNTIYIMQNPITPVGLFHTPENVKELQDILASYTAPGESNLAQTAAFMAWNLASKIIDEVLANKKDVATLAGTVI
jgi:hypothetical protein